MTTALLWHPACRDHDTGPGHAEQPARMDAVLDALSEDNFPKLVRLEAPRATQEQLLRHHPQSHLDRVFNSIPERGSMMVDQDTVASPQSGEAALRAAGAAIEAVNQVMTGGVDNAFCAVRPPGHHAEPTTPMGFCFFNNIALGAAHAIAEHQAERVAVVDFDVHHGNGTQAMFENDSHLFFGSIHQMPLYPGTGAEDECGVAGNIVNIALPPHAGSREFRIALESRILPALYDFKPDLLMISAGFDAHQDDPLANICLTEKDYFWATGMLTGAARDLCEGRIVSTLEGGYNLDALARSVAVHVSALMASGAH